MLPLYYKLIKTSKFFFLLFRNVKMNLVLIGYSLVSPVVLLLKKKMATSMLFHSLLYLAWLPNETISKISYYFIDVSFFICTYLNYQVKIDSNNMQLCV